MGDLRKAEAELTRDVLGFAAEAVEKEQGRWQKRIRDALIDLAGYEFIDGSACDSGDPLDVTLSEIQQAFIDFEELGNVTVSKRGREIVVIADTEQEAEEVFQKLRERTS